MKKEFETLNMKGLKLLDADEKVPVLRFNFGLGFSRSSRLPFIGDTYKRWTIAIDVLPDLEEHTIFSDEKGLQTRFRYFYEFWQRHAIENKPFIIIHPTDSKRWLVGFTEINLPYEFFTAKVFRQSGIEIETRIEPGVSYLSDGSLGDVINPDEI